MLLLRRSFSAMPRRLLVWKKYGKSSSSVYDTIRKNGPFLVFDYFLTDGQTHFDHCQQRAGLSKRRKKNGQQR